MSSTEKVQPVQEEEGIVAAHIAENLEQGDVVPEESSEVEQAADADEQVRIGLAGRMGRALASIEMPSLPSREQVGNRISRAFRTVGRSLLGAAGAPAEFVSQVRATRHARSNNAGHVTNETIDASTRELRRQAMVRAEEATRRRTARRDEATRQRTLKQEADAAEQLALGHSVVAAGHELRGGGHQLAREVLGVMAVASSFVREQIGQRIVNAGQRIVEGTNQFDAEVTVAQDEVERAIAHHTTRATYHHDQAQAHAMAATTKRAAVRAQQPRDDQGQAAA